MSLTVVTELDVARRRSWIERISQVTGDFAMDSNRIQREMTQEFNEPGISALLGHLRLCGVIPEKFGHDSSEEKLYSKYTDIVIEAAFTRIGFSCLVLSERAGVADVECLCGDYGFVADAKSFRLSRTAKNQKDFKVQALDSWKHGKPFAILVCPWYQLPSRTSQIYQQATSRSVCIWTYTHLAALARYADLSGKPAAIARLREVFRTVETINPSKDAVAYWQAVNRTLLQSNVDLIAAWREEKLAAVESIQLARDEALQFLAFERERIMRLSREEAIQEVIKWRKIETRVKAVGLVADNGILDLR